MKLFDAGHYGELLKGRDFIVFSDDWGRHPFSCQHIMKNLLPCNRVLWVNTIGMRRPRLSLKDFRRSIQKLQSFAVDPVTENLPDNLTVINPPMLPFGNFFVRSFNRHSVISAVKKKLREMGVSAPIILTTLPNAAEYLGSFGEELAVYYCVDDFTLWPGVNEALVKEMECRLLERIDLLICSSSELAAIKTRVGLVTEILPHGVDYTHFSRCTIGPQIKIHHLESLQHPVIGYFGLLGEWVDISILEALLLHHPEWSLVLMGNVVADTCRLKYFPNVYFTGPVPYEQLPDHVAYLDVLILPYCTGGRGITITPLKLREYIATGKPVVATAIPECLKFDSIIHIAETVDEFVALVEIALQESSGSAINRQASVRNDSWLQRAELLSKFIRTSAKKSPVSEHIANDR